MRINARDLIALGALILGGLAYMKVKKSIYKWILVAVALLCFVAIVFWPENQTNSQSATTSGSNSPATIQTATTTGSNSPIIQAAAGATVNANINYGISEETMRKLLIDEDNNSRTELSEKYPQGYALLGYASGAIVFEPRLKNITVKADWNNIKVSQMGGVYMIFLSYLEIDRPGQVGLSWQNITLIFPAAQNQPTMEPMFGDYYLETLDAQKGIFLIGFK